MIFRLNHLFFLLLWVGLVSCTETGERKKKPGQKYAQGFSIRKEKNFTGITVRNPWEKAGNVEFDYYLVPRDSVVPTHLSGKTIIRIPVKRIICLSTSHIAFLSALGLNDAITGISGASYITNPYIRRRIAEGLIRDVGYDRLLNYEEIIRQHPDLVMVYGVDSEITGVVSKLQDLGIPAVYNAEYLEQTPLGKAEWIKFVAEFFRMGEKADSVFNKVRQHYDLLKEKVAGLGDKPVVMVGMPYRDAWWIPGGRSYLSVLLKDAGANYVARENPTHESFVISMEEAFLKAERSEYWIHVGSIQSKTEILETDSRFRNFTLFKNGRIFNNNKRTTPEGGNDFWESGAVYPDSVLADLIAIFHPEVLTDSTLTYYKEIK